MESVGRREEGYGVELNLDVTVHMLAPGPELNSSHTFALRERISWF